MNKQISILEDDPGIREIVTLLLEGEGYDVFSFPNVLSFMAREEAMQPNLYLLDIKLPDGNGLEVCKVLKSEDKSRPIPVMMMSAHEGVEQMKINCPADDFIAKPFDILDFLARVNQLLANHQ